MLEIIVNHVLYMMILQEHNWNYLHLHKIFFAKCLELRILVSLAALYSCNVKGTDIIVNTQNIEYLIILKTKFTTWQIIYY